MTQEILELFAAGESDEKFLAGLTDLASRYGDEVYREALWQLMGKTFDIKTARHTWDAAINRRRQLSPDLGLRPALLHYLHYETGAIRDPRVLEGSLLQDLRQASVSDGLTGLFNQTHFKLCLERLLTEAQGGGRGSRFAVVLLDLDRFKEYNDCCGHLAGYRALALVAETIRFNIRQGDLAARYGGEEFALVLHRIDAIQTWIVADRIRRAIAALDFAHQDRLSTGNLTISCGFALSRETDSVTTLVERADQELYRAKKTRNAVCPDHTSNRRASRRSLQSVIEFAGPGADDYQPAISYDISTSGLALGCDRPLRPGATVQLRFRRPFWPDERQVEATVRHVREENDNGMVRIGLEFLHPLASPDGDSWSALLPS